MAAAPAGCAFIRCFAASLLLAICSAAHPQTASGSAHLSSKPAQLESSTALDSARHQIESGDFLGAEKTLEQTLLKDEASAQAHALLAYARMRLNKPKESLAEYTRAAQLETPSAQDLRGVASDYVLLNDYKDADYWTSRALLMDKTDPETWYSLGRIRYELQRFQEAADCFQETLRFLPKSVKAANNLGLVFEGLNRPEDAAQQYRLAVNWQSTAPHPSEQPLLNLAILLVHQGKADEALPLLQQAVAIAPGDAHIRDQLGHIYMNRNALEDAQREYEKAVSLSPGNGAYHFLLGQVYRRRGMLAQAKAEFQQAAELDGTHSSNP